MMFFFKNLQKNTLMGNILKMVACIYVRTISKLFSSTHLTNYTEITQELDIFYLKSMIGKIKNLHVFRFFFKLHVS
jgi:hypothetical protein